MTTNEPGWVAKSIAAILIILRRIFVYRGDRYFCDSCSRELYSDNSECCGIDSVDNWKDGYGNVLYQTPHRSSVIRVEKRR